VENADAEKRAQDWFNIGSQALADNAVPLLVNCRVYVP